MYHEIKVAILVTFSEIFMIFLATLLSPLLAIIFLLLQGNKARNYFWKITELVVRALGR